MQSNAHVNFCHCTHCRDYQLRIYGGANGEKLTGNVASYLMRGVVRDISLRRHPARLSVRWVASGRYAYEIRGRNYVLEPGKFLLVADGEIYNSASDSKVISESLTVSFDSRILTDVLNVSSEREEFLLDNPFGRRAKPETLFFTDLYQPEGEIKNLLDVFSARAKSAAHIDQTALDQTFYELMERLVFLQKQIRSEIRGIPSRKAATREELYRRLRRARDFIRANSDQELKIEEIARVACLSPYHFLRTYKSSFGITPHQELLDVRLEKARRLMNFEKNNFTLGRIAIESGFNNLSSFSKAFRQKFKIAPSLFESSDKPAE
jgi:AraC-like DNA-binding protein